MEIPPPPPPHPKKLEIPVRIQKNDDIVVQLRTDIA